MTQIYCRNKSGALECLLQKKIPALKIGNKFKSDCLQRETSTFRVRACAVELKLTVKLRPGLPQFFRLKASNYEEKIFKFRGIKSS